MKFRKKPVVIEATQWFKNGDHPEDGVGKWAPDSINAGTYYKRLEGDVVRFYRNPDADGQRPCEHCEKRMHDHGWIDTKEGGHIVCPGDWIITGIQGERYPCKPDIFEAIYEPAEQAVDDVSGETITIDLNGCARCHGEEHKQITFKKLTYPLSGLTAYDGVVPTFWASCPTNGEPILMTDRPKSE